MAHLEVIWYLLAAASAGVFLHAGIKFPWFVFFRKDSGLRPPDPPWNMRAAMLLFAALCVGLGVVPGPLYALLPFKVDFVPYTGSHVIFQLQLLLFSGLAFFLMLGWLQRTLTITLDVDNAIDTQAFREPRHLLDHVEREHQRVRDDDALHRRV